MTNNKNLHNPLQQKAIKLLSSGVSKTSVAEILGISRDTIYDWLKEEWFIKEINNTIDNNTRELGQMLSELDNKAIKAIERALDSNNEAIALKAALGFIDARKNLSQIDNIYDRIEMLESIIGDKYNITEYRFNKLVNGDKK
jgi:predicted transcriptional regulator